MAARDFPLYGSRPDPGQSGHRRRHPAGRRTAPWRNGAAAGGQANPCAGGTKRDTAAWWQNGARPCTRLPRSETDAAPPGVTGITAHRERNRLRCDLDATETGQIENEVAHHPAIPPRARGSARQLARPVRAPDLAHGVQRALDVPRAAVDLRSLPERPLFSENETRAAPAAPDPELHRQVQGATLRRKNRLGRQRRGRPRQGDQPFFRRSRAVSNVNAHLRSLPARGSCPRKAASSARAHSGPGSRWRNRSSKCVPRRCRRFRGRRSVDKPHWPCA